MRNLAIIIPAFKEKYLRETLESLSNQTNKDFNVYIGDDCSPHNLVDIVTDFDNLLSITYKRFDYNLGSTDLVAHWNRCVGLVAAEEWIWMFSDDDLLDINCVELFYSAVKQNTSCKLWHFNVRIIDDSKNLIKETNDYPTYLTSLEFFNKRINYELDSFVVEYIINKQHFLNLGAFDSFDLAWAADDAAWIKFGDDYGIYTIPSAYVYWRLSGQNISSIENDKGILLRKLESNIEYLKFANGFFSGSNIVENESQFRWIFKKISTSRCFSFIEKIKLASYTKKRLSFNRDILSTIFFILTSELKLVKKQILTLPSR